MTINPCEVEHWHDPVSKTGLDLRSNTVPRESRAIQSMAKNPVRGLSHFPA
jgi:hypothetical protein